MDEELWNRWFRDAAIGLAVKYSEEEVAVILGWMQSIKSRKELDLVGAAKFAAIEILYKQPHFNVYDSMMYRGVDLCTLHLGANEELS